MDTWQREMYLVRQPYPSEIAKIKDFLGTLKSYKEFQNSADKSTDDTAVWETHRRAAVGEFFMTDRWDNETKMGRIVLCQKTEKGVEDVETLLPKSNYQLGGQPNGCWLLPYHFIS